ncbi:hypothetical protein CL634_05715 [bacterium]|nr:hypothetical protein [bacterium]
MKLLIIIALLLSACGTPNSINTEEYGVDQSLWEFDQTGWACSGNEWNIWLYYDDFDITNVNAILYDIQNEKMWSKILPEVGVNTYQKKFIAFGRQCHPHDVNYTIFYLDKEPETIWLYWNEDEN